MNKNFVICRRGCGLARAALTTIAVASCAFAAIDGHILNRTTGKLQPGATVTLYKLGQAGPEALESVKSDEKGQFRINQDVQGPRNVQASFAGVTYSHVLPPGSPTSDIEIEVYNSSKNPGDAKIAQHMVFLEPVRGELMVSESYIFRNEGKVTYDDPGAGTLKFYLPEAARGAVKVNGTAPRGMPVPQAAEKTSTANVYTVDFPIRPGETRIDVNYSVPFASGGTFAGKVLYKGGPTRLVVPTGVTLKGEGLQSLGQEPQTQASIYDVKGSEFKVEVSGAGSLRGPADSAAEEASSGGPTIDQIQPKVYNHIYWIVALGVSILALGFLLLYRAQIPEKAVATAAEKAPSHVKEKNERRRR